MSKDPQLDKDLDDYLEKEVHPVGAGKAQYLWLTADEKPAPVNPALGYVIIEQTADGGVTVQSSSHNKVGYLALAEFLQNMAVLTLLHEQQA